MRCVYSMHGIRIMACLCVLYVITTGPYRQHYFTFSHTSCTPVQTNLSVKKGFTPQVSPFCCLLTCPTISYVMKQPHMTGAELNSDPVKSPAPACAGESELKSSDLSSE